MLISLGIFDNCKLKLCSFMSEGSNFKRGLVFLFKIIYVVSR
jgi:hypothetical protein